jgi:hypothetical protein
MPHNLRLERLSSRARVQVHWIYAARERGGENRGWASGCVCGVEAGTGVRVYAACDSVSVSVVSSILYWVRNLDSSLSPLTVGVVWVCVFYSTLCICTVETLKDQAIKRRQMHELNKNCIEIR